MTFPDENTNIVSEVCIFFSKWQALLQLSQHVCRGPEGLLNTN